MRKVFFTTVLVFLGLLNQAEAQVVGYAMKLLPANSDTHVSLGLSPKPLGLFNVSSASGANITVTGANFPSGALVNGYYARVHPEGSWSTITANSGGSITTQHALPVAVGGKIRIYKHHTLESVFPDAHLNKSFNTLTQIRLYRNNLLNMPGNSTVWGIANYVNGNWTGTGGINNATVIEPETMFVIRNSSGTMLRWTAIGEVADYSPSRKIAPNGDLVIGSGFPVNINLTQSNLGKQGRSVLFFNNAVSGFNKTSYKTAFFNNGQWTGSGITGTFPIYSLDGYILRLPSNETATKISTPVPYPLYTTPSGKSLRVEYSGTQVRLIYNGILQVSSNMSTWTDHPGFPQSPFTFTPATSSVMKFYRVR